MTQYKPYGQKSIAQQQGYTGAILVLFIFALIITAIVALFFGHKIGYQKGVHQSSSVLAEHSDGLAMTSEQLEAIKLKNEILTNEVASAKQELAISLNNLDELRRTDEALRTSNKQLTQVNELYAKHIADNGGLPLEIMGSKIVPLPENAFEYGFDVAMVSKGGKEKTLTATLTLLNDDSVVDVPLDPKRYDINGIARIRGRFIMPDDFTPKQVKLKLSAGGQNVNQLYNWKLGKKIDNMPISLAELSDVDDSPIEDDS